MALLPRGELPLLGDHNVANALTAALAATRRRMPRRRESRAGCGPSGRIPHRVEPVREVDGVLWINDSKSTNITSTEVAIAALDRPFVLLLGGRHKGEPYTRLVEPLRASAAAPSSRTARPDRWWSRISAARSRWCPAGSFDEVLGVARGLAQPGDAVLLSPACSSYDMFKNYEERGARFRQAVEAL